MGERIANHCCQFAAIQNDGALSYCVLVARLSMLYGALRNTVWHRERSQYGSKLLIYGLKNWRSQQDSNLQPAE